LHNQRQNQNNERRGNEQKTAADNAGRNNRRSVIIVEVMADGANFGLFVQWRSKQKTALRAQAPVKPYRAFLSAVLAQVLKSMSRKSGDRLSDNDVRENQRSSV